MLHDIGENVLIIHPYLILDEEIELDRETTLRGFHVAHHQREIGIDLRTLAQILLHEFTVKLEIGRSKGCRIL
ncbi:Uncharacterised protein [Segatella copri]|nr:Uncharacterised protein [Segatella copri]